MSTTNHHRGKDDKEHLSKTRENTGREAVTLLVRELRKPFEPIT